MNAKRYCTLTILIAGVALGVVAGFNLLLDPFGVYPRVHLKAFDHFRESIFNRTARAELTHRGDWNMMILGTSRPKAGMPAQHPTFGTNRVCNLSVDAARMSEAAAIFDYARVRNPVRRVLLCLDFALSRYSLIDKSDFAESRFNPKLSLFDYHCKNMLGGNASDRSWEFLMDYVRKQFPPAGQRNGFFVHGVKPGARQRALFEKVFRSLSYGYAVQRASDEEMAAFRHMLAVCRENNIEITLAINPVHALDLELLRAGDNWERFEQWKRDVVRIVAEESMEGRVAFWDFTGYWPPTTEEVPPASDGQTRMKYYFENSHFTPAMGALILDCMYGNATNEFGAKISTSNIEAHLARIREQREAYVLTHATDVQWVQRVAKQVLATRKRTAATAEEIE
ncbi:MAG TPA: hypothetical protein VNT99_20960 [Methylomirabilota bacterium]|nr:hypothetical protein [Methylomirabilota bacterium]